MAVFEALYSQSGGPPHGYFCRAELDKCKRVVRTRRGMVLHLWRRHRVRLQLEIDLRDTKLEETDFSWIDE